MATVRDFLNQIVNPPPGDATVTAAGDQINGNLIRAYQALSPPLATSVQVTGGAGPVGPIWANVASVTLPNLILGEVLLVTCDLETTQASAITYNTATTTQVVAGTSVGDAGEYVIRANAMNNTPNIHHLQTSRSCVFVVDSPARNVFTLMVAGTSDVAGANDFLTIETFSNQILLSILRLGVV